MPLTLFAQSAHTTVADPGGVKRAVVAVAHTILIIAYHILHRQQSYQDLGSNYFDQRERSAIARQSVRCLEQLGFKVTLETRIGADLSTRCSPNCW